MEREAVREVEVDVPSEGVHLAGTLALPAIPHGVVVFAHGSGSGRMSPRNRFVARLLQDRGMGTLLLDLLTREEEREDSVTSEHRFDVDLLGERLTSAVDWLENRVQLSPGGIGCYGASTGAAAALIAAAARPALVGAVVSRGGRPDLIDRDTLGAVRAPTLLIVGGRDQVVVDLNRRALAALICEKQLELVPGATHLFVERGALERVASLAGDWFAKSF